MSNIYWSWTLPWNGAEALVGLLIADDVELANEHGIFTSSLVSIGLLLGRIDIIFNVQKLEE